MIVADRLTDTRGAAIALQHQYMIESRMETIGSNEVLLLARRKSNGERCWLKCSNGSQKSVDRLKHEAALLSGLIHSNIVLLAENRTDDPSHYLVFPYSGEIRLSDLDIKTIAGPDRVRIVSALTDTIEYLQSRTRPVAHRSILTHNVWLTPSLLHPRLFDFSNATEGAKDSILRKDREAVAGICGQMLPQDENSRISGSQFGDQLKGWVESGSSSFAGLRESLRGLFLSHVTEDL